MSNLKGKVAIITGCGAGIGKQMAIKFAEDGANLAICDIAMEKLQETVSICEDKGASVLCAKANVTKYEDLQNFVNKAVERFGTIDILINNAHGGALPTSETTQAGMSDLVPFIDTPIEHYQHFIEGNLYSTINMMKLCYPHMKGKKDASIINISSASSKGMHGLAFGRSALGTAKGAVADISRMVAYEWGKDGIRVNIIYPGVVTDTLIAAGTAYGIMDQMLPKLQDNPLQRAGNPYEDVAPVAAFLASEDSKFMTGQALYVNGGNWMSI